MWLLKACPKCGGDLNKLPYLDGPAIECLQCGRVLSREEAQMSELQLSTRSQTKT
ncbi:MAG: hypothetical protein HW403_562 [Dehalococcoidia bacterium]|nr:hypothetical protein [Dehalococcoidia bacterium]